MSNGRLEIEDGLWTDGGCVKSNPSPHGGVWAWCLVEGGRIAASSSGIILPGQEGFIPPKITNNLAELWAAWKGIKSLPDGWSGNVHTDSLITLRRITGGTKFKGIPKWLVDDAAKLRRGRKWRAVLVGGHPSRAELKEGINRKGWPVSVFNCWCDDECRRLAKEFVERMQPCKS